MGWVYLCNLVMTAWILGEDMIESGYELIRENQDPISWFNILRKEVIQPQVPLRLPCYDLVPIRKFTFGADATSGTPPFRGLTGGVYKAQEHIHRGVADPRLLAIPTSCRRVAACNLNWGKFFEIGLTSRFRFPLFLPL
ncbi:Putative uncharacterized protein OS=uncultured Chloroflexi bacterium HF0200_09I09 PE=4 SV=1 [Tuwongella immobilis]|uniref:Uncharacterized protein n=1 Tax=Tuwongella immobilis TaxID=692036 RepID=A0A6C2YP77_9BACT|nr:Putative uncharacterized protein OS=uncultured Chloroflexi bacterium HF0200_09I09 PE=4 SV=1 [Tuwongella immobilis]VTS03390.1 Putative uncharacterized protein OS=uncultured Chloroflexi bacterium HF0200_09I09 PE=4 SV=1 [Tuwongella immobilis]